MAKPPLFQEVDVLKNALSLFWSRGFEAASLRQLEEVTDLHPGSIYHRFGSKRQLYLEVLKYYVDQHLQHRIDRYLVSGNPIDGIRRFISDRYRHDGSIIYRPCCFLVKTTTELDSLSEEADLTVQLGFDRIEEAMTEQLLSAKDSGTCPNINPETVAQELTALYISVQLMACLKRREKKISALIAHSLNRLTPNA